ncbi:N-(5-amino-5-carboxypentanoyl)-L-cysteinyl-D-valine synthase [Thalictrum thalictroides]|uniref:N-(5-amino-5-carboxypentanoyl)-L-cysteinyl-D-valine synthase n=1 Tax=Thalictrum thalictroides TaxID=46969 RepID=A0A7J6WQ34_THATH|nr:N-(5-amino-5-carboxypentanoyl)-L-cysteinyl-D-valine synthase [Thalictrum thalictroides]
MLIIDQAILFIDSHQIITFPLNTSSLPAPLKEENINNNCRHFKILLLIPFFKPQIQVLLQGLPRFAAPEDIEHVLSGCDYNSSNHEIFLRQGNPDPVKWAFVKFPSKIKATNAVLSKNKGFCQNDQVFMRVLH